MTSVTLERRFSQLQALHHGWIAPVMSHALPVQLPATGGGWGKNSAAVISSRRDGFEKLVNAAIELSGRLQNTHYAAAIQRALSGPSGEALQVGVGDDTAETKGGITIAATGEAEGSWDAVGFWSWGSVLDISQLENAAAAAMPSATTQGAVAIPHVLELRSVPCGKLPALGKFVAAMLCRRHPAAGEKATVCLRADWRSVEDGAAVELSCRELEVTDCWGNVYTRSGASAGAGGGMLSLDVKVSTVTDGVAALGLALTSSGHIESFKLETSGAWIGGKITAVNGSTVVDNTSAWAALSAALPEANAAAGLLAAGLAETAVTAEPPAVAAGGELTLTVEMAGSVDVSVVFLKQTVKLPNRGWARVLQRRSATIDGASYGPTEQVMLSQHYRLPSLLRLDNTFARDEAAGVH